MTESADPGSSSPMHIDRQSVLADLVTQWAGASRVFARHNLDFCCRGQQSIAEACEKKGIEPDRVVEELRAELAPIPSDERWDERPVAQLLAHLVDHYHAGHRRELPRLIQMAEKVEKVHAGKEGCPQGLAAQLRRMATELDQHMKKEEELVFPFLLTGKSAAATQMGSLEREHEQQGERLAELRRLTGDFTPPAGACNTWRALYLGLFELECELMQHVHLENHVLLPKFAAES